MTIQTFKRYELKYLINQWQYDMLCAHLVQNMDYDGFCSDGGSYMIYNIYFDTVDDAVIRKSTGKPYYKEKLRLRSYKMPTNSDDLVFLELKKKIGGIVTKRRAVLHYDEAMEFALSGKVPSASSYQDKQVVEEISDFLARYAVVPRVYISYQRVAFFGKDDGEFRVSFDKNILTRRSQVNLYDGDYGAELLDGDCILMEIKCAGAIPLWLVNVLSQCKAYATSFSKYGTEFQKHTMSKLKHIA